MIQNVEVQLDEQAIQSYIEKQLEGAIKSQLWYLDVEKLSELTCMSKRHLEEHVLSDVRFRAIEIRKNKKRWYKCDLAKRVLDEILSEW